jgi:hypothetical protein
LFLFSVSVCLRPVFLYPMLPVSLDYPFMISPSVFSNVYYLQYCVVLVLRPFR